MTQWSKVIEKNWDAIVEAMAKAAKDAGELDGDGILRVELNSDGTVDTYVTFQNITSADVYNGDAIRIKDYYGGDCWSEDWADSYDADYELDMFQQDLQSREKMAEEWGN